MPVSAPSSACFSRGWLLFAWMFAVILFGTPHTARAQGTGSCERAIAEATDHFLFGRFEQASSLLEDCLRQDAFSDEQKRQVYKLLVQIYDAKGLEERVKAALADLLALVPDYEPDPGDPPSYRQLVEGFKRDLQQAAELGRATEEDTAEPVITVTLAQEQGEAVRNARLRLEGDRLIVSYDLVGTAKKYNVQLLLSPDGGQSYLSLPQAVTGDVGKGMRPGLGKQVAWATLEDFPEGLAGDQYRLQVATERQRGRGLLYVLGGAVLAGGGTTVALLLGGNGGDSTIPTPPGRPSAN